MFFLRSLGIFLIGLPFLLILFNLAEVPAGGDRVALVIFWIGCCLASWGFDRDPPKTS